MAVENSKMNFQNSKRERSRSRSPVYKSRSKSPREWKRPERRGADRDRSSDGTVRIYVSNLPYELRWQELKDLFKEKVGSDVSFTQLYEESDGRPSGSGVVEVKSRESATKAINLLDRYEFKGRKLNVREERERDRQRHGASGGGKQDRMMGGGGGGGNNMGGGNMSNMGGSGMMSSSGGRGFTVEVMSELGIEISNITNQVFIANLDYKVTKGKLEEVFRIAGNVIEAEIKTDHDGKSRGMGIVRFEHPIEAVQAISLFNGQFLYDRQIGVRMDRWVEPIMQDVPMRLPSGLKSIGVGMGHGGQPLMNLGEIANTLTLSMLTGQLGASPMGLINNTMAAGLSAGMGMNMAAMGSNLMGMSATNMPNLAALGNVGSNLMSNLGSMAGNVGSMGSNMGGGSGNMGGMSSGSNMNSGMNSAFGAGLMGSGNSNAMLNSMVSGLGSGMSGLGSGLGMGDSSFLSSGMGSSMMNAMSGNLASGLSGMSDSRMNDQYGGRDNSSYDRGGSYERMNSSFDRGNDRNDSRPSENSTVFVKNLPFTFTTQNMYDKFRDCGDVKFAEVKTESNGRSRGIGIVQFYNSDCARRAISLMNGARFDGRTIEVRLDRML